MTPAARFSAYRARIDEFNPGLGAFIHLRLPEAEREAAAADIRAAQGRPLSPIDGWCIAVKANIAVAGLAHHAGIAAYHDCIALRDSEVVSRLKAAGAVILGIVNMHEGALGATTDNAYFGRTQNPWRHGLTPGGSSGGSACAVAAGLCDAALGSDTMGSVRIPSAYCGVQGHKPSRGLVPDGGVLALSPTLDHVGPHARTVEALRGVLSVLSGQSAAATVCRLEGLRAGVWRAGDAIAVTPEVAIGFRQACAALEAAGAELVPVTPPAYAYGKSRRAGLLVSEIEAARVHARMLADRPGGFTEGFRSLLAWGTARPQEDVDAAYAHIRQVEAEAAGAFADCEVILAPTAPQQAFAFSDPVPANQADFTAWADFAALPACAVFTGVSQENGLPLGMQVIGLRNADAQVLSVAAAIEALLGSPPRPAGYE